ncbi:MAG: serine O-acetyltransferase [bacterium]|nr:serine O-acetyltransferase [bacterium]
MLKLLREDVATVFERDPAVKSVLEAVTCYPGLHAIWLHRLSHRLYRRRLYLAARFISHLVRFLTGIEIHPGARIGRRCFIDHGLGVVIGETAEIGNDVTIYQGVTLGGTGKQRGKRHPTLADGVVVAAGAKVLGAVAVGANSRIGAGAVVVRPVPPNCTVVGVPGRIVVRDGVRLNPLDHGNLPDPQVELMDDLLQRVARLERQLGSTSRRAAGR